MMKYPFLIFWLDTKNVVRYETVENEQHRWDTVRRVQSLRAFKRWRKHKLPSFDDKDWLKEGF